VYLQELEKVRPSVHKMHNYLGHFPTSYIQCLVRIKINVRLKKLLLDLCDICASVHSSLWLGGGRGGRVAGPGSKLGDLDRAGFH
jgi:hypothetical protein